MWEARVLAVEGRRGGAWRRWWLGGEASWWLARSRVCVLRGVRSRVCSPFPMRGACLYGGRRVVDGVVALIADVVAVGNLYRRRDTSRP
jgi:hypothetical protein